MASRDFFGREIVSVLQKFGYRRDRTRDDHVILKYTHLEMGEQRTVTVPLHDRVRIGTLQSIAEQCGAGKLSWPEDRGIPLITGFQLLTCDRPRRIASRRFCQRELCELIKRVRGKFHLT
jgi:predicted RNA binding protein YcfA (HicA-like mRNA interferase family)